MDFGKLSSVDHVQFRLPEQDPRGLASLQSRLATGTKQRGQVRLGAPVWACKGWVGKIYPPKTPAGDFLKHYSRQFDTIELNSSFYRTPDAKTVEAWRAATPEGFHFCPKIHQTISHAPDLCTSTPDRIESLGIELARLEDRMGVCFLQLPPSFAPAQLRTLARFLEIASRYIPLAVEFRHPGWFERRQRLRDDAFELLSELSVSVVITDVAGRRDVLHSSLTTPRALIRFVGNELHPSDYSRGEEWVERVKLWLDHGLEELYWFVHEPDSVLVPELTDHLIEGLNSRAGQNLRKLTWYGRKHGPDSGDAGPAPEQMSVF